MRWQAFLQRNARPTSRMHDECTSILQLFDLFLAPHFGILFSNLLLFQSCANCFGNRHEIVHWDAAILATEREHLCFVTKCSPYANSASSLVILNAVRLSAAFLFCLFSSFFGDAAAGLPFLISIELEDAAAGLPF